ncbi:TPA: site-specific integrase, partial [Streptococcus suis]|nr:site-specific integrase [Streptococcus suis]HEL2502324.1 site-specific integrase [Streptococcus suis]HEM3219764.1 site-specific integrase [Streptococcus suis]HEM3237527.1 site-specific integrase [Streptococcus suis]HEM3243857.1 site-specific integrase [Streptococcus suis]
MNLSKEKLLFHHYYANWLRIYKEGAIREVTLKKYRMTLQWLIRLAPSLLLEDLNRVRYQELINSYAKTHERQTTMDFHHQLKGA